METEPQQRIAELERELAGVDELHSKPIISTFILLPYSIIPFLQPSSKAHWPVSISQIVG
jgi:hypothetical protein